jgi:hypothetical protein
MSCASRRVSGKFILGCGSSSAKASMSGLRPNFLAIVSNGGRVGHFPRLVRSNRMTGHAACLRQPSAVIRVSGECRRCEQERRKQHAKAKRPQSILPAQMGIRQRTAVTIDSVPRYAPTEIARGTSDRFASHRQFRVPRRFDAGISGKRSPFRSRFKIVERSDSDRSCARAASGHTAAPPRSVMNSHRRMNCPRRRPTI